MIYKFKPGAHISRVDPQRAGDFLEDLRCQCDEKLSPELVVEAAKPKRSPIHNAFQWDDTKAAHQYRLEQARGLLRSIVVEVRVKPKAKPTEVRAFVCVLHENDVEKSYTDVSTALTTAGLKAQVLAEAIREAKGWQRRYAIYAELAPVFAAIHETEKRLGEQEGAA